MSMVLSPKKFLLLLFVLCLPIAQIKPMENHPAVKTYKLVTTVSNAAQETKNFYIKINHKIATASVIGICLASGVGSGAAAFLLLKSYGAALLYGAISGQCAIAYQLLAKKFDKGFKELKDKIDLLNAHIDDNHNEIMQKVVQGNSNIETNNLKITELSQLVNANFKIHGDQLALAINEIKKTQETQITSDDLEQKLGSIQKRLSDEIAQYSTNLDQRDARKHKRLLNRIVKTAKKINPDADDKEIISLYKDCTNEQLISIVEDQKEELRKIKNDNLHTVLDGMNNNLQRHEELITTQGATIQKMSNALETLHQDVQILKEQGKETSEGVRLLVLASNHTIERERVKAEEKQKNKEESKRPVFTASFNPYKPAKQFNQFPRQLKHDSNN